MPLEADEDARKNRAESEEVPTDRDLEAGVQEAVEMDDEGEEDGEAYPSSPSTIIKNPP